MFVTLHSQFRRPHCFSFYETLREKSGFNLNEAVTNVLKRSKTKNNDKILIKNLQIFRPNIRELLSTKEKRIEKSQIIYRKRQNTAREREKEKNKRQNIRIIQKFLLLINVLLLFLVHLSMPD